MASDGTDGGMMLLDLTSALERAVQTLAVCTQTGGVWQMPSGRDDEPSAHQSVAGGWLAVPPLRLECV